MPVELSRELAYFCGFIAGDGSVYTRLTKHDYIIKCVGDPKSEQHFYDYVIEPMVKRLFNIDLKVGVQDSGETYGFVVYSKGLLEYLTRVIGLPCGKKYDKLRIPSIFKGEKELTIAFLRGLADTDFYLGLKRGSMKKPLYPIIVGSSKSFEFMHEVAQELEHLGFKVTKYFHLKQPDKRFVKGYFIINRIELCGHMNYELWMKVIGFLNKRHLDKACRISFNNKPNL
ncbi:MAG: hypothetical protein V1837_07030 [Candidatus Woesearchaeota archaeon]